MLIRMVRMNWPLKGFLKNEAYWNQGKFQFRLNQNTIRKMSPDE